MKIVVIVFLCVCILSTFSFAFANENSGEDVPPSDSSSSDSESDFPTETTVSDSDIPVETSVYLVSESNDRISSSDTNGLKSVMLGLIGDYNMVTKEYRYTNSNGYSTIQVTTEPDYAWMFSFGLFAVILYCIFRLIGGVLCGRS